MTAQLSPISKNGPFLSAMIAGFWRLRHWELSTAELHAYIEQLLEVGVTTMDHAWVYRSEAPFGAVLKSAPSLREKMQIVTKCGIRPKGFGPMGAVHTSHFDSSAKLIETSLQASLQDLNTDYVDVLLLHRPDYLMDVHEVAETFSKLQQAGLVRYFGVSNFNVQQVEELHQVWPDLVTNQVEFSPYNIGLLDSGELNQCSRLQMRPMLWSCLAGGKIFKPEDARGGRVLQALKEVAAELKCEHLDEVLFAWVLSLPCKPLPILGTRNIERVKVALRALDMRMSREQWYKIWEAANGAPVP